MANMSKIHFLQVKHGDALIIQCSYCDKHGIVVVDGGPPECGYILNNKLKELGLPDLLVLTHYDDDHIGGIIRLVNNCLDKDILPAQVVWANCAGYVSLNTSHETSAKEGTVLSTLLSNFEKKGLTWRNDISEGNKYDFGFATIEVVSPTKEMLDLVIKKQEYVGQQVVLTNATKRTNADLKKSLQELSKFLPNKPDLTKNNELANASSIAFILRCEGLSILMLGDSYPQNVIAYLKKNGYSEENPLEVDYVKISHHGSRNNTSSELLDIIKCNNYLISTNGGKGVTNHPDRITIAHVLCHPKRDWEETVHLFFNHSMEIIENKGAPFLNPGENKIYNFEIHDNVKEICI